MTPRELKAWRKLHGFTQSEAAGELHISVSDFANFERGEKAGRHGLGAIPPTVERACELLDHKRAVTSALRVKINEKLRADGPPGHITPQILREILLEIVDAL